MGAGPGVTPAPNGYLRSDVLTEEVIKSLCRSSLKHSGEDRWAFANHMPWAKRSAHHTKGAPKARFRRLPPRTGVKRGKRR
jgi:hypothetical protein